MSIVEPAKAEQLLTLGQIRAAWCLLGLSKEELAKLASVSVSKLSVWRT